MSDNQNPKPIGMKDRVARAICREHCAFYGEPPCFQIGGWPNPNCDEPGCLALAAAVLSETVTSDDELLRQADRANAQLRADDYDDCASVVTALAARIHELKAEIEALKSDLSGYMDAANTYVNELHGVHAWTHTIVPVEPTPKMQKAGFMAKDRLDSTLPNIIGIYRAMIRAAQPDATLAKLRAAQEIADEVDAD